MSLSASFVIALLHLVERVGEGGFEPERLLDLVGGNVRILAVFQEARQLVLTEELDRRVHVRLPVLRPALEIGEHGRDAGLEKYGKSVLDVLVEVRVENALVHEMQSGTDVEQDPAQVV